MATAEEGLQAQIRNIESTYGQPMSHWLAAASGPPQRRLEPAADFNALFTHRVRVSTAADIDTALIALLRQAYDRA